MESNVYELVDMLRSISNEGVFMILVRYNTVALVLRYEDLDYWKYLESIGVKSMFDRKTGRKDMKMLCDAIIKNRGGSDYLENVRSKQTAA